MLLRGCEIDRRLRDVRLGAGRIVVVAARLDPGPGERAIDAQGGALLPGLNDHHAHLFASSAALASVRCGPPAVCSEEQLGAALRSASGAGWLRGVDYHESVAGDLERRALDRWTGARPARIQHRTGALWVLNSAAINALGLDAGIDAVGVERDGAGRATGRLYRLDAWLRARVPSAGPPRLDGLSASLARCGVVGVTDTGADNGPAELSLLEGALRRGELRQRVLLMGRADLPEPAGAEISRGARKLLLDERALPELGGFIAEIEAAHRAARAVGIHCVTRVELVFALAALRAAGSAAGDRIEHASVAPPELVEQIRALGLAVVTQPAFVAERGDDYLSDVAAEDRPWLYRARAFLAAGVPLAAGSDSPYAAPDPWRSMQAAVRRHTEAGRTLGSAEALTPEEALALFTSPLEAPGAPAPALAVGARADLCLLDAPWAEARRELSAERVRATWRAGALIWDRDAADTGAMRGVSLACAPDFRPRGSAAGPNQSE